MNQHERATAAMKIKQEERQKHSLEERRVMALEEIADTLESIRGNFQAMVSTWPSLLRRSST